MSACARSHIVFSGTSSGIGRAAALGLAAAGHHVFAGVRQPGDAPVPPAAGSGEITPLLLDVTDPAQIGAAAGAVAGHTGGAGLTGLVNNAGIGVFGPLEIIPVEQFRHQLEVNVTGQLAVSQALLPLLRRARGRIVLIGSIGTRFTPPFTGPVSASKSTIATMAEALWQELAPWDIRVVLIEPASIHTEAVRMDRRFQVRGRSGCLGSTLPDQQPDSAGAGDMRLAGRLVRQEGQHLWRTP